MDYNIAFPTLNLYFNINRVAIKLFGHEIYWYGIIIAIAILVALFVAKKNNGLYGIKYSKIEDFAFLAIPMAIIFARAYYVIFSWDYYSTHLDEIAKLFNGGLAIYGGIIGGILSVIIFCKVKDIFIANFMDYLVPSLAIGQVIGRFGNFVNREAYGTATNLPWRMEIFEESLGQFISVHPTFLYEALGMFIIFVVTMRMRKNRKFKGQLTATYFVLYGILRLIVEGFRVDSLMFYGFRISQIVSIFVLICGMGIYFYKTRKKRLKIY